MSRPGHEAGDHSQQCLELAFLASAGRSTAVTEQDRVSATGLAHGILTRKVAQAVKHEKPP